MTVRFLTLVPSSDLLRADSTGASYLIFPNSSICSAFFWSSVDLSGVNYIHNTVIEGQCNETTKSLGKKIMEENIYEYQ